MKVFKKRTILLSLAVLAISAASVCYYNAVDNSLSEQDKQYIPMYLRDLSPLPHPPTYKNELDFIIAVQHSVLNIAPRIDGIPYGQQREPKDLYEAKTGLCYDRSRVIEKILRYSAFKARHISIFSEKHTGSAIKSLFTPGVSSHAVTEVLTKHGWLVVDSNAPWVSTDSHDRPISMETIQQIASGTVHIQWHEAPPAIIYEKPFVFVIGLYSRHGYFFPPFNRFPDINYGEFIQNFI